MHRNKLVADLFDDMRADFCDIRVRLQIASRNVKRHFGAVENTFEHKQIIGDYLFDIVRNENAVVEQFYLSLYALVCARHSREVKNTLEIQRIIRIQMNMEYRFTVIVEYLFIELVIILFRTFRSLFLPQRLRVVYRFGRNNVSVLVLFRFLADDFEIYRKRHKCAILFKNFRQFCFCAELFVLFGDEHRNFRSASRSFAVFHNKTAVLITRPLNGGFVGVRFCFYRNLVRNHERGVKAETEMTDYTVVFGVCTLVFFNEIKRAGKRDVVYIISDLVCGHAYAVIINGNGLCLFVKRHGYAVAGLVYSLRLAYRAKMTQFCYRVACVRNYFTQKNILVRIKPTFDYREYMFRLYGNTASFFHIKGLLFLLIFTNTL